MSFVEANRVRFLTPEQKRGDGATEDTMRRLVYTAHPACHTRMRMAAHGLRAEPRLSRRLCTDRSDPYAVLGVLQTADQVPF